MVPRTGSASILTVRTLALSGLLLTLAACAPTRTADGGSGTGEAPVASGPKRATVVIASDPITLRSNFPGGLTGGAAAGVDAIEQVVHVGVSLFDDAGTQRAALAEVLPTVENGLWRVLPDGRMETLWTLKNGVTWQDGTALTAQDLLFTLTVCKDPEMLGFCQNVGFDSIESVNMSDDRTLSVTWKRPFIEADMLFAPDFAMPMPRHLLERAYLENKRGFTDVSYWNRDFVGAGPFRVREWVPSAHIILSAFDDFVLGRPKLDEVVVKLIPDSNTLVSNMLAGGIDANLGRGMSLEQGIQIRDHWPQSRMEVGRPGNVLWAYPQFIDPRPAVLADAQFRKALVQAMDRQEMANTLQAGLTTVAHTYFDTDLPQYRALDPFIVKYDFDPRRAAQIVDGLGYVRGADGSYRDAAGQILSTEIRDSGQQEVETKAMLAMADYWQRIGIKTDTVVITPQRMADREYLATRPAFQTGQNSDGLKGLRRAHSSQTPLAENNYTKTGNNSRYMSAEFDVLLDRFFATIPLGERTQALGQLLHHSSDQNTIVGIFFAVRPLLVSNHLVGLGPKTDQKSSETWNVHEWDLRS